VKRKARRPNRLSFVMTVYISHWKRCGAGPWSVR